MKRFIKSLIIFSCLYGVLSYNQAKAAEIITVKGTAESITVKGSDTMVILGQRLAEEYMNKNKDVTIQVTGGGSGTGIAALLNKTTNLANSSRPIKDAEAKKAREAGVEITEVKIAMDGLAVVVNRENPVSELTMKQILGIYTGHYKNWKDVGGPDQKIMRYSRESNSGTYVFFKEHVLLDRDYAPDCQTMSGTSAVAEAVSRDKWGIGFGGVAYFEKIPELKIVKIKKLANTPAVSPIKEDRSVNYEQIWNSEYPIARYLYVYVAGKMTPAIKKYIDWTLGPEGQNIVAKIGYVPLQKK